LRASHVAFNGNTAVLTTPTNRRTTPTASIWVPAAIRHKLPGASSPPPPAPLCMPPYVRGAGGAG